MKPMGWRLGAMVLTILCSLSAVAYAAPVKVTGGQVEGRAEDGLTVYRGIPFAAPPVGPLRWKPPQPVKPWSGVRQSVEFGPACMQGARTLFPEDAVQSEDCLTLNVWTPAKAKRDKLPVMVWIYGGGFTMGSTRPPLYSGANFAKQGVVLVSIQYRVGRFGFFAHPALTQEDPKGLLGNYAFMDQIAGLEWVQKNIAAFGGDPGNVTIFGESAGGVSINALMATQAARGLFQKAISESGFGRSVGIPIRAASGVSAENQGLAFAESHNINGNGPDAAAALRALSADEVLRQAPPAGGARTGAAPAAQPGTGLTPQPGGAPGGLPYPMIDGVLFKEQIVDTFKAGRQAKVPYIAGGNSYEASLFSFVRNTPARAFDQTGDGAQARTLYVANGRDEGLGALDLTTDLQVTEPNRFLARLMAKSGQPAWTYYFNYVPPSRRGTAAGASHGDELGYVFATLPAQATPDAIAVSKAMHAYWIAFAKTGKPGAAGGPQWDPITASTNGFMVFGPDGARMTPDFNKAKLDFISDRVDR